MITATTLCQHFLDEQCWLAGSTRDTVKRAFDYFAEAVCNREIDRIEPSDGERYKGWHLKTFRSKNTANMHLRSVKRVLNWAVETRGLLKVNPLAATKQFKITRNPVVAYESWQVERMIRYAPDLRWKAIIMAAWTTGLRRGALLNLTVDNIRDGFVYVEPKRKTSRTWPWEPKDQEIRQVPCVGVLKTMFDVLGESCHYLLLAPKKYAILLQRSSQGIITERSRKCPLENFTRTFNGIQRQAFGRQLGDFHQLRKTYTTDCCDEGLPAHFIMKLTGHSNLKTMTYYLAGRESYFTMARKAIEKRVNREVKGDHETREGQAS